MSKIIILSIIIAIESSGNPLAYNQSSGARGLCQITPIVLLEFNKFNRTAYELEDLFHPDTNKMIAEWYLYKRIPQMLEHFNKPVTERNVLICYNAGIRYVAHDLKIPSETERYIEKYQELKEKQ